jgi:hypothetical protein
MVKKLVNVFMIAVLAVPLAPTVGMCWYGGPPPPRYPHYYNGHHGGGDAWVWGLGGLVLGTAIAATVLQPPPPPPPQRVVYVDPQPVVYSYQPRVAPRMCRWERYVLDGYGRTVFDQYGQPVKEYSTGPCGYPPN